MSLINEDYNIMCLFNVTLITVTWEYSMKPIRTYVIPVTTIILTIELGRGWRIDVSKNTDFLSIMVF